MPRTFRSSLPALLTLVLAAGCAPVTEVASGLRMPWGLTFLPDGSALVSSRDSGDISHVPSGGGAVTWVGTIPGVAQSAEGGLLGLAASPGFATAERARFMIR